MKCAIEITDSEVLSNGDAHELMIKSLTLRDKASGQIVTFDN
jgi:hypothetical protein